MQQSVPDPRLECFSDLAAGGPERSVAGLRLVWLHSTLLADAAPDMEGDALRWEELSPAQPRRLLVRNHSAATALVRVGTILGGGMSARAVAVTTAVPSGAAVTVAVEAVGARWWQLGTPRASGVLAPPLAALVLHARLSRGGLRACARTVLWSLTDAMLAAAPAPSGAGAAGWVLLDAEGVVAAHARGGGPGALSAAGHLAPAVDALPLLDALARGVRTGRCEAHMLDGGGDREVAILPRDRRLVDRVLLALPR